MCFPSPLPLSKVGDCEFAYIVLKAFEEFFVLSFLAFRLPPNIPRTPGSSKSRRLCSKVGQVEEGEGLGLVAIRLRTFGGCGKAAILTERRTSLPYGLGSWLAEDVDGMVGTVGVDLWWPLPARLPSLLGLEDVLWAILANGDCGADGILELSEGLSGAVRGFGTDKVGMVEGCGMVPAEAILLKESGGGPGSVQWTGLITRLSSRPFSRLFLQVVFSRSSLVVPNASQSVALQVIEVSVIRVDRAE